MAIMASIGLIWMALFSVMAGLGFWTLTLLRWKNPSFSLIELFWIGFAALIAALQIWQLFARIDLLPAVTFFILGCGGCILLFLHRRKTTGSLVPKFQIYYVLLAIPLAVIFYVWLTNRAVGNIQPYDSGLYHLPTIRWLQTYPIIPGLGNLHHRFAYNNSYLLYLTMLDIGPWIQRSFHLGCGLLLLAASLPIGGSLVRAISSRQLPPASAVLRMVMIVPLGLLYFSASSTSSDIPAFLIGIEIGVSVFRIFLEDADADHVKRDVFLAVTLSALSIAIKSSCLVTGLLFILLAGIGYAVSEGRPHGKIPIRELAVFSLPACLLLGGWVVRGILLSGYPFYPLSVVHVPVQWKMPTSVVVRDARDIMAWARSSHKNTDQVLASYHWLIDWVQTSWADTWNMAVPGGVFGIAGIFLFLHTRTDGALRLRWLLICLPLLFGLLFWFVAAPDPRFAGASIWLMAAIPLALLYRKKPTALLATGITLAALVLAFIEGSQIGFWTMPGPDGGLYPAPAVAVHTFTTQSGLVLYVPDINDQCWNAPLPCTPDPDSSMRLIVPGNLASGFLPVHMEGTQP
jgi:hypothetical protein